MRPILGTALLAVLAAVVGLTERGAAAEEAKVVQELIEFYRDWTDAVGKGTVVALFERNAADDFTFIDALTGALGNKKETIERIKALDVQSWEFDDIKVRAYGETAVVTSRWTLKGTAKGKDISGQYRSTEVWVKRSGGWQEVASQATRIEKRD